MDLIKESDFELDYPIAKNRIRIAAFLLDFLSFWAIGMVLGRFFGEPIEGEFGFHLSGFPALVMFLIGFFLWPVSEGLWGQTIGKRLLNLKVISHDFQKIRIGQAFIRFFLGFVDCILLIGLVIAASDKQNKRIGDLAAKTIVIDAKKIYTQQRK